MAVEVLASADSVWDDGAADVDGEPAPVVLQAGS